MARTVAGTLLLPNNQPMANARIFLTAKRTEAVSIVDGSNTFFTTNGSGVYSQSIVNGWYSVSIEWQADPAGSTVRRWVLGDAIVETAATTTLEALLIASNPAADVETTLLYEVLTQAQAAAASASASAAAAAASAATITPVTSSTDTTPGRIWNTNYLVKITSLTDAALGRVLTTGYAGMGISASNTPNSFSPASLADMTNSISGLYRSSSTTVLNGLVSAGSAAALPGTITLSKMQFNVNNSVYPWYDATNTGRSGHLTVSTTGTILRNTENWNTDNFTNIGLGSIVVVPPSTNMSNATVTGFFAADSAYTGNPIVTSGVCLSMARTGSLGGGNFYGAQFWLGRDTDRAFARRSGGGPPTTFGSWYEFWTSANTSANVQTMLGAVDNAAIRTAISASIFPAYTLATLPSAAANTNMGIIVTNLTAGREPCWSDGTNWRRASDRSIAS
jgi:hypothetical protein